jgi:TP901 family phage tail tape measure protein
MASENVTTKFRVDISDLKKNIAEANRQVKQYRAELANASAGMQKGEETADSLSRKIEAQSKIVEAEKAKLQALKDELSRYERKLSEGESLIADLTRKHQQAAEAFGEDSEEAQKLAKQLDKAKEAQERNASAADNLRTRIVNQDTAVKNAEGQVREFSDSLNALQNKEKETGDETEKVTRGSLKSFSVALGNLASTAITDVIKKLGELGKAAIDAFQNFDEGRDVLIKATGAAGEAADELTKVYSEVSKSVSGDLSSIGSAIGEVNTRFGFTGDELKKASESFMKFADITGTDAVQAVQLVSRAMGDAGIDASEYANVLDELSIAAQASGISVDKLTEYLTKYGAPMRALGLDTKESIAIFSQWEKAGVNTEIAFSGMKTAISKWSAEGKDAREEFQKTLAEISSTPDIASATTKAIEAFGKKAGPDLADAIKGGRFEYSEFLSVLENSAGTVEKTYAETQSGIDKIKLAVQGLSVTFGEAAGKVVDEFAPKIQNIISLFGSVLSGDETAENDLADAVTDFLTSAMEKAADALPDIAGFVTRLVGKLSGALAEAAPSAVDALKNVLVTVLNAASEILPNAADTISDNLPKVIEKIFDALPEILAAIRNLGEKIAAKFPELLRNLITNTGKIVEDFSAFIEEQGPVLIQSASSMLTELLAALPDLFRRAAEVLTNQVPKLISVLMSVAAEIVRALPDIVKGIADAITALAPLLIRSVMAVTTGIVRALPDVIRSIVDALPKIITVITEVLPELIGGIVDALIECQEPLLDAVLQLINEIVKMLPDIIQPVMKELPELFDALTNVILQIVPPVLKALGIAMEQIAAALPEILQSLWDSLTVIFDPVAQIMADKWIEIENSFSGVGEFFKGIWEEAIKNTENAFSTVAGFFSGIWDSIKQKFADVGDFFKGIWQGAAQNTESAFGTVVGFFSGIWEKIRDVFYSVGDFFGGVWSEAVSKTEDAFGAVLKYFSGIWKNLKNTFTDLGTKIGDTVGGAIKGAINGVLDFIEDKINAIPDAINSAIDLINNLPGVEIKPLEHISLPRLEKGGIAKSPTIAQIGENGQEAIIPLEKNQAGMQKIARMLAAEIRDMKSSGNSLSQTTNNITNEGTTINLTQNNTSPKALSLYDQWRQTRNMLELVKAQGV